MHCKHNVSLFEFPISFIALCVQLDLKSVKSYATDKIEITIAQCDERTFNKIENNFNRLKKHASGV